jgi:hypothetical protein
MPRCGTTKKKNTEVGNKNSQSGTTKGKNIEERNMEFLVNLSDLSLPSKLVDKCLSGET